MTRADQWAAFVRAVLALTAIALITATTLVEALKIGPAAAGLLYLLPVLWVSAQAGLSAGLASAGFAAFCYNFFLLEPHFTLRIHGPGDAVAFMVLVVVAVVTSRLASGLRTREREARERAEASAAEADFVALLAKARDRDALDAMALDFLALRYGDVLLVRREDIESKRTGLAPIDAAAAAWALHNGEHSGHASEVMPSADYAFVALSPGGDDVLALPAGESAGAAAQAALARLWTQARDRLTAETERHARAKAEQRESVRRALVAALGHDFRTPLTVLKAGLAELEGDTPLRLGREVDRIVRLSEDLIAAARLDAGQTARIEPVDLIDIVATLAPPTDGAVTLLTRIPNDLPLVRADPVMLVHIVGNLVDNALRHARKEVAIAARLIGAGVELTVRDDGDGIDPAVRDRLFDPLVAGRGATEGSGLGLAIARDLARAMDAALSVSGVEEGGACFALLLQPVPMRAIEP